MLMSSSNGITGDLVELLSPFVKLTVPRLMSFYYNLWLNATDSTASLTVYKCSQLGFCEQKLLVVSGDHGFSWQLATICLPVGVYRLAFVGTVGLTYSSDIGLDEVSLSTSKTSCPVPTIENAAGELQVCHVINI